MPLLLVFLLLLSFQTHAELTPEHKAYIAKIEAEELKRAEEGRKVQLRAETNKAAFLKAIQDGTIAAPQAVITNPSDYGVNGDTTFHREDFTINPDEYSFTLFVDLVKDEGKWQEGQHVTAWLDINYTRADGGTFGWCSVACE